MLPSISLQAGDLECTEDRLKQQCCGPWKGIDSLNINTKMVPPFYPEEYEHAARLRVDGLYHCGAVCGGLAGNSVALLECSFQLH